MGIHVGLLVVTYEIPSARTLKEKRSILQSMIHRARNKLQLSISEVDFQNRIRSGTIALALVGTSRPALERLRDASEEFLSSDPRLVPVEITWEWL